MVKFPFLTNEVPHVVGFFVAVDDAIVDGSYNTGWTHLGSNTKDIQNYTTKEIFGFVEDSFMRKDLQHAYNIEVTANHDSAILLVEFIDSWISERKICIKAGTWNGV